MIGSDDGERLLSKTVMKNITADKIPTFDLTRVFEDFFAQVPRPDVGVTEPETSATLLHHLSNPFDHGDRGGALSKLHIVLFFLTGRFSLATVGELAELMNKPQQPTTCIAVVASVPGCPLVTNVLRKC